MTFFTSDDHYSHSNILRYCHRPWATIEEHDEALTNNWNHSVTPKDTIYILGDFAWRNPGYYADRLNGYKILILGSHDKKKQCLGHFAEIHDFGVEIKIEDKPITLCHYRMAVWPRSHYGSLHLYGHTHNLIQPYCKELTMDVGVDCNNYAPVSWDKVKEVMADKLNNILPLQKDEHA
jgi:calcineurin-like phosphoesterase family protein